MVRNENFPFDYIQLELGTSPKYMWQGDFPYKAYMTYNATV